MSFKRTNALAKAVNALGFSLHLLADGGVCEVAYDAGISCSLGKVLEGEEWNLNE